MTVYFNPRKREYEVKFVCDYCGKELKSASGKTAHEKACSENPANKIVESLEEDKAGE